MQQPIHAVRCNSSAGPCTFHAGKLALLEQICCDLGVHTTAQQVEGLWIVPLKSWYHSSFDREPDIPGSSSVERVSLCILSRGIWSTYTAQVLHTGRPVDSSLTAAPSRRVQVFKDFRACRWPDHFNARDTSLAQHFDQMNIDSVDTVAHSLQCQSSARQIRSPVITFSHYLPFQVHLICSWETTSLASTSLLLNMHDLPCRACFLRNACCLFQIWPRLRAVIFFCLIYSGCSHWHTALGTPISAGTAPQKVYAMCSGP